MLLETTLFKAFNVIQIYFSLSGMSRDGAAVLVKVYVGRSCFLLCFVCYIVIVLLPCVRKKTETLAEVLFINHINSPT